MDLRPSDSGADRRKFERFNMALDVSFGPLSSPHRRPAAEQLERTLTTNLSFGGLCLYSDILYPIGARIYCGLVVPGRPEPVDMQGTVVWFHKLGLAGAGHGYKLGVEFRSLSPEAGDALRGLFERPPEAAPARERTVLLVEDDADLMLALQLRFESVGFHVLTASEGREALRVGRQQRPHLIILDLILPHLNGYEVCRLLKFDPDYKHIPILILTARSSRQDLERGLAMGADAYLTKPFDGRELLAKVEELITSPRS